MICRWLPLAFLACCLSAEAEIELQMPIGGWKHSGGEPLQHEQQVNYPASRVNAGATRVRDDGSVLGTAIRGRIGQTPKPPGVATRDKPALLVVNGVALPLRTDADGRFARPYAFPPGSNGLVVTSPDRREQRRVQFYDAYSQRQRVGLRVVLAWDSDMTDLDLHVVSPDGEHVFYGKRQGKNGGSLDVDVTDGYGPEIYAIVTPPRGLWHLYVNYYGRGQEKEALTIANITLVTHEGTPDEKRETFHVPMRRPGELTLVKSFQLP